MDSRYISDCTLRDARHAPGVYISPDEAQNIARILDKLRIDEIEIGVADPFGRDAEYFRKIAEVDLDTPVSCVYFCLNSTTIPGAIQFALDHNVKRVCISIPTSDTFVRCKLRRSFRAACKLMERAVDYATCAGMHVAFSGEDAARASIEQLKEYVRIGLSSGAKRFRFAESVACLSPAEMTARIADLVSAVELPIEVHCHSAYGLSVANTVAAIDAGAQWASVTIGGIGERGGNTPLAPILLYLANFRNETRFNLSVLKHLEDYTARVTGLTQHRFTSIVGDDAFCYENRQQFENFEVYEDFPPELVGNERALVLGNKSDPMSTRQLLSIDKQSELDDVMENIRHHVQTLRRPLRVNEARRSFPISSQSGTGSDERLEPSSTIGMTK